MNVPCKWVHLLGRDLDPGFVQETRHKNQGLFKDFPAPNKNFPGPFVLTL